MRIYREEMVTSSCKTLIRKKCDVCGKEENKEGNSVFRFQEFIEINFSCGYGSVFGDGESYECDICQDCTKRLLGSYLRKVAEL